MSHYQPYNGYNNGDDFNGNGFDGVTASSQTNRTQVKSSLTPVTIKMIHDAKPGVQDGQFEVFGIELNFVSITGIIRNVTDNTSNLQIQLEDGTGLIDLRKWTDDKSPEGQDDFILPGTYVYVTGSLKDFSGKPQLSNATFHKIEDFNQVIYHQLSVIDAYNTATGKIGRPDTAMGGMETSNGNALFVSKPEEAGLTLYDQIYKVIAEHTASMPEGVPVQFISQKLNITVDDVQLQCARLSSDAKIYVGYDENAYLSV